MKLLTALSCSALFVTPVIAEESRQMDAHEHGVGQLNIAFDGQQIAVELHAPGADIVGFEYAAETTEDRAAIDNAVATLARPLELFMMPDAAGCSVVKASAGLESEDDHGHDDHDDDHDEDHADGHDDHDEDHADGHDDHGDDHDSHDEESSHTEFHAEYLLNCTDPKAADSINFAYFETFPNALEVEVQVISDSGATAFEVERESPTLDLSSMF